MQQKSNQRMWVDESRIEIPYSRITKHERLSEIQIPKLVKEAIGLHDQLAAFKARCEKVALELLKSFLEENDAEMIGKGKGSMKFYIFDRSMLFEISAQEPITFDDNLIQLAKEILEEVFGNELSNVENEVIKAIVLDSFATSRGKLDVKKVLGMRKYAIIDGSPNETA